MYLQKAKKLTKESGLLWGINSNVWINGYINWQIKLAFRFQHNREACPLEGAELGTVQT
jgi:hypothetical protein